MCILHFLNVGCIKGKKCNRLHFLLFISHLQCGNNATFYSNYITEKLVILRTFVACKIRLLIKINRLHFLNNTIL